MILAAQLNLSGRLFVSYLGESAVLWSRVVAIARLTPAPLGVVLMFLSASPTLGQSFVNVTAAAGITHNAEAPSSPITPTFAQVQSGGAAAGDFDNDGWVDLYVTRYFDTDLLYRNLGATNPGEFADVTGTSFGAGIGNHETNGAAWGDIDNDGDLDLAVATINESRHLLYINDGVGNFTEAGDSRGIELTTGLPTTAGTSFAMGDYDHDGYLDMYVTEWRDFTTTSTDVQARLYRNRGAASPGFFEDVTNLAGVRMDILSGGNMGKGLSFTPRFSDLDRDGLTDIAVVADAFSSKVFWNNGDGTFTDGTDAAGINTGTNDMGYTLGDFNGDGLLDWFATSVGQGTGSHPSGNRLYLNDGDRTFTDATDATGVREGGWGWGADVIDFDNDGDLDIAHTNGMTIVADDQSVLFENTGDRANPSFVNNATTLGIVDNGQGRGLLTMDYDRDGDLDLFIVNYDSAPILYRNDDVNTNDWLRIRTVGNSGNRDGIGAYITVTPDLTDPNVFYVTEIDGSSNYLAQSEAIAHLGLGELDPNSIDQIEVDWPSGYKQVFTDVAPNQLVLIIEGLVADFNDDDRVGQLDLDLWEQGYGISGGATAADGDADRDGDVDGNDLLIWQRQHGRLVVSGIVEIGTPLQAVPEPSAFVLSTVTLSVAGLLARTRRRAG